MTTGAAAAGYLISHQLVDSFVALNQLLAANGRRCIWLPNGDVVCASAGRRPGRRSRRSPSELGVGAEATSEKPAANALKLRTPRIGLWDQYGGSMDSGWARWILEQYQFPFEKVFPPMLDAGNLNAKYDVIVFVEGGIPAIDAGAGAAQPAAADIPAEYRPMLGRDDRRAHHS